MTQVINQFSQTPEKGQPDLQTQPNVIPCVVDDGDTTALVPGQAVKLKDGVSAMPIVTAATVNTDEIFGFVPFTFKDTGNAKNTIVEIFSELSVIYLEAGGVIARGKRVMYVPTGEKVVTATAAKTVVGIALDKAGNGDLVRVLVKLGWPAVA